MTAIKGHDGNCQKATVPADIRRIASLAVVLRLMCIADQLKLRDQSLTVTRYPQWPATIDFTGREPFGFTFTEGHDATFHLPSRLRFVIEHLNVSCWANNGQVDVHLVTKSPRMFRHLTLMCSLKQPSLDELAQGATAAPIVVNESTANTFLFSHGEVHSSSTVPPETCVQIWGYLEPVFDAEEL